MLTCSWRTEQPELKPTACPWLAAAAQSSTQLGACLVRVSAVLRRATAQTRTPMSRRRCKHVLQSVLQDDAQPPTAGQSIVRAVGSRGGNHVEAWPCLLALQCVAQDWQPHLRPLACAASARSVELKRATQLRAESPARLPACLDQQSLTQDRGFHAGGPRRVLRRAAGGVPGRAPHAGHAAGALQQKAVGAARRLPGRGGDMRVSSRSGRVCICATWWPTGGKH